MSESLADAGKVEVIIRTIFASLINNPNTNTAMTCE